ncbi:methyl-accepting chemotaxis protein, partial [Brachyspira pulli]
ALVTSIENVSNLSTTSSNNMEIMDKRIKELQYIFLQLYKLVISFKTEKTEEDIDRERVRNRADKAKLKLERKEEKRRSKEEKKKIKRIKKRKQ